MQKQAPSFPRILTMVLFALSCFGLLLFLWLSFGGAIPLKPSGYRFKVAFPEATQLGLESDVRVAGVSVGKVRTKEVDPRGHRTIATIEVERRFAPIRKDARAMLRQKTLLGETYVELTPGTPGAATVKEGHFLANSQVVPTVELDEIFQALDPTTRQAFHIWQQDLARTVQGRGQDFSDALGNFPALTSNGTSLLSVLDEQHNEVRGLFRDFGTVLNALSRNEGQLRSLITNSSQVFRATAAQNESLAETFHIFPVFLDESRLTMARLRTFAIKTDPLIRDLKPVMRDLKPTLHDVRLLAPDLRRLFKNLGPLIEVSKKGLPALKELLVGRGSTAGAKQLLEQVAPFLSQLNPVLEYLELYQLQVAGFLGDGKIAITATEPQQGVPTIGGGPGHYLRQSGPFGPETVGIFNQRDETNRGNSYPLPLFVNGRDYQQHEIFANWDCVPSGGPVTKAPPPAGGSPTSGRPPCWIAPTIPFQGQNTKYPRVFPATYRP